MHLPPRENPKMESYIEERPGRFSFFKNVETDEKIMGGPIS